MDAMLDMNKDAEIGGLSVVVVPMVGEDHLQNCLEALKAQATLPAEIIVPFDNRLGKVPELSRAYPDIRFLHMQGQRTFAELRAHAVRNSSGAIVAITEDHCKPEPNWCACILKMHSTTPYAAIGGAVEKETPDTTLDWAIYFADYLRYSNPLQEGPVHALTDLNVAYKREALDAIEPVWTAEFHENIVHAALEESGEILWLSPEIVVRQKRHLSLREAIRDRYAFGRLFGSTRVSGEPASRRLVYTATSVLVPVLLVSRVVGHIRQKRRWVGEFIRALPALVLISTIWGWGEFTGYITGRPDAKLSSQSIPD